MKTLVLGSNGQLGQALADTVPDDADFVSLDIPDLDITNASAVSTVCRELQPDVIINAAAYTAVDLAETETELAAAVNVIGPRNIAAASRDVDARLIHISTDFVFDGQASRPYDVDAPTNPLSVYGRTKRDGELAILEGVSANAAVLRTAWLYSKTGKNFVKTMLALMGSRDEISVVADQRGTPTWANSLAVAVWSLARKSALGGIFHWTDAGETTWHEFAVAIQEEALELGLLVKAIPIHPISTDAYPTAAVRPSYSVLNTESTFSALDLQPTPWRINLSRMLKGMNV